MIGCAVLDLTQWFSGTHVSWCFSLRQWPLPRGGTTVSVGSQDRHETEELSSSTLGSWMDGVGLCGLPERLIGGTGWFGGL